MKHFCILPWIHTSARANGSLKLCCKTERCTVVKDGGDPLYPTEETAVLIGRDDVRIAMDNQYMNSIRHRIMNGELVDECKSCFIEEQSGQRSKRQEENDAWSHLYSPRTIKQNNITASLGLRDLDIRLGNRCNLKCVMCGPTASSMHVREANQIVAEGLSVPARYERVMQFMPKNGEVYDWVKSFAYNANIGAMLLQGIERLHLSGGEPTLNDEMYQLLSRCIMIGSAPFIDITMNTNLANLDHELLDMLHEFKSVTIHFSVDATDARRSRYIRYPQNFEKFDQKVQDLLRLPEKFKLGAIVTFMNINLLDIIDVFEYVECLNSVRRVDLYPNMLYEPSYYAMNVAPNSLKNEIRANLSYHQLQRAPSMKIFSHNDNELYGVVSNLIRAIDRPCLEHEKKDFVDITKTYDKIRSCDFKETFPEFIEWFR